MNILGLSFDYHDSAAAIICNGEITAAAAERAAGMIGAAAVVAAGRDRRRPSRFD